MYRSSASKIKTRADCITQHTSPGTHSRMCKCCKKCCWCIIFLSLVCGWIILALLIATGRLHISQKQWQTIDHEREYFSHQFWHFWYHNYYAKWITYKILYMSTFHNKYNNHDSHYLVQDIYATNSTSFQFSLNRDLKPGEVIALRPNCQKFSSDISFQTIVGYSLQIQNQSFNLNNDQDYSTVPNKWNDKSIETYTINWISNVKPVATLRESQLWAYSDNYQVCLLQINQKINKQLQIKYNNERRSVLVLNMPHSKEQKSITLLRYHIAKHAFDGNSISVIKQRQIESNGDATISLRLNLPTILPNVFSGIYKKIKTLRVHSFGASFKALHIPSNTVVEIFMTHRLNDDHDTYFMNNLHILKKIDQRCYNINSNDKKYDQANRLTMKPLFPNLKTTCEMLQQFQWNAVNNPNDEIQTVNINKNVNINIDTQSLPNVCLRFVNVCLCIT